jgi:membrane protein implicated in regulation of membrane protease activity
MPALIWLIAALGLAGAEALTGDLFLLMLSGGALAAAGSTALFDWPIWTDGVVFLVVSLLLLVLVRPALRKRFAAGDGLAEPMKALEGKSALVLDRVARHEGQVKLDGEVWTARPLNDDDVYEQGDHVTVMRIDGATAVVFKTI